MLAVIVQLGFRDRAPHVGGELGEPGGELGELGGELGELGGELVANWWRTGGHANPDLGDTETPIWGIRKLRSGPDLPDAARSAQQPARRGWPSREPVRRRPAAGRPRVSTGEAAGPRDMLALAAQLGARASALNERHPFLGRRLASFLPPRARARGPWGSSRISVIFSPNASMMIRCARWHAHTVRDRARRRQIGGARHRMQARRARLLAAPAGVLSAPVTFWAAVSPASCRRVTGPAGPGARPGSR